MDDSLPSAGALPRLPDKLAFVSSAFKCVSIPLGLYLCFSSVLFDDNLLVTQTVICMKCLIALNFILWTFATVFTWTKTVAASSSSSKKVKVKFGYLFKCLISMLVVTCGLHVFIVLFGAPLTVEVAETFYLAALSASLSLWPCIFLYGLQWDHWVTAICVFDGSPFTGVEGCVSLGGKGALIGLWLGAIPIPLDWDRPWQRWPITCVVGTLIGHFIGLSCYVIATLKAMKKDAKRNKHV